MSDTGQIYIVTIRDTAWTKTKQLGSLMRGVLGGKKETERRGEVICSVAQDTHPSSAHLVKVRACPVKYTKRERPPAEGVTSFVLGKRTD